MAETRARLAGIMPDAFPIFFGGRQPYEGQACVMPEIVRGNQVLFASPTASGKTEAAVTPLFQRHLSFNRQSLSTIYVAPTKALVNDLYERLVGYLGPMFPTAIARYTGDRHELKQTAGVFCLMATPEALDSLQLRRPEALAHVRAVIVDEIHLLHGQPRGQQLRHVVDRVRRAGIQPRSVRDNFQVIGMTATLDDMGAVAKTWLGDDAKVFANGSQREIDARLIEIPAGAHLDPYLVRARALAKWLETENLDKVLVFANSRNGAHSLAAYLHQELEGKRWPVHLHFGALAASHRERVEEEMRRNRYGICVSTSTLEIGIDIGDIDAIVLADLPWSVSSFLQRIGRGNRRSGLCRVIAFRSSEEDERMFNALTDCSRRGELDDAHEYDRPSVRFQQALSLCWRATRQERGLSTKSVVDQAASSGHAAIIDDMIDTGRLASIRGALIPCDRLMDEGDAGRIHTVIAGQQGAIALDMRTGEPAMRDADESTAGGAIYIGGSMRELALGPGGDAFLRDGIPSSRPLARIRSTGKGTSISRTIVWGLARQLDQDPTIWSLNKAELVTWGGERFNNLIAALLCRECPGQRFTHSIQSVSGPFSAVAMSIESLRGWAIRAEEAGDLPLDVAGKFTNPSRYMAELSSKLAAEERRQSIPWNGFQRWLNSVSGIHQIA